MKTLTGHLTSALYAFSCNSYLLRRRKQGAHPGVRHIPSLSGFNIRRHYWGTPCRVGARGIVASLSILHIQYSSKRHHHTLHAPGSVRVTPLCVTDDVIYSQLEKLNLGYTNRYNTKSGVYNKRSRDIPTVNHMFAGRYSYMTAESHSTATNSTC